MGPAMTEHFQAEPPQRSSRLPLEPDESDFGIRKRPGGTPAWVWLVVGGALVLVLGMFCAGLAAGLFAAFLAA